MNFNKNIEKLFSYATETFKRKMEAIFKMRQNTWQYTSLTLALKRRRQEDQSSRPAVVI